MGLRRAGCCLALFLAQPPKRGGILDCACLARALAWWRMKASIGLCPMGVLWPPGAACARGVRVVGGSVTPVGYFLAAGCSCGCPSWDGCTRCRLPILAVLGCFQLCRLAWSSGASPVELLGVAPSFSRCRFPAPRGIGSTVSAESAGVAFAML